MSSLKAQMDLPRTSLHSLSKLCYFRPDITVIALIICKQVGECSKKAFPIPLNADERFWSSQGYIGSTLCYLSNKFEPQTNSPTGMLLPILINKMVIEWPHLFRGVATVVSMLPRNPPACRNVGGATLQQSNQPHPLLLDNITYCQLSQHFSFAFTI